MKDVLPAAVAFIAGFAVEYANYAITRSALKKDRDMVTVFPLRTIITAAFFAILYFASRAIVKNVTVCMIAAALGATAGLVIFTMLLMNHNKKGGGTNG